MGHRKAKPPLMLSTSRGRNRQADVTGSTVRILHPPGRHVKSDVTGFVLPGKGAKRWNARRQSQNWTRG